MPAGAGAASAGAVVSAAMVARVVSVAVRIERRWKAVAGMGGFSCFFVQK